MEIVAIIGSIAALVGGILYVRQLRTRERTASVSEAAGRMSWTFQEAPPVAGTLAELEPFSSGRSHRARNRVTRERDGEQVSTFDLHYVVQAGKHAHHYAQTLAEIAVPAGTPQFVVRPEHFGHRIAAVFGMQDFDLPEHPVFSKAFLLRGPDESGIRSLFRPAVVEFFEGHPGIAAVCTGTTLYLYFPDRLIPAQELYVAMERIRELRKRIAGGMG